MDWQLDYRLTNSVLHRVWNLCPYYGWMDGWMGGWVGGWMDGCTYAQHTSSPPSKVPVAAWPMQHQNVSSLQRITWEILYGILGLISTCCPYTVRCAVHALLFQTEWLVAAAAAAAAAACPFWSSSSLCAKVQASPFSQNPVD